MRTAIGVERAEKPSSLNDVTDPLKTAHGPFLRHEKRRTDLVGGVLHGHDQVPPLAGDPFVARSILMQHHPRDWPPGPLAPMRAAPRGGPDPAMRLQGYADPVVAELEVMRLHQLVVKVPGREIPVARVEQLQNLHHRVHRNPVARCPAKPPVKQPLGPLRLEPVPPAPEGALRHPQNLRRLHLAQLAFARPLANLLELHQSQPLQLLRPSHDCPPLGETLKPDRSRVTSTGHIAC